MTLRRKTLMLTSFTLLTLLVILAFSANTMLLGGFSDVETRETEANLSRATNALQTELNSLQPFLIDWAEWDDTYEFVAKPNPDYIKKNLSANTFLSQKIQLLVVLDNNSNVVFGTSFNSESKTFHPIPDSFKIHMRSGSPLLQHQQPGRSVSGIVSMPESPLWVASFPIINSERTALPRGLLLVGRFLDSMLLAKISESLQLPLQLSPYASTLLPLDFVQAKSRLSAEKQTFVSPLTETRIAGYSVITDLYGNPGYLLRVDAPRFSYLQGRKTVQYFVVLLIGLGLLFSLATLLLLEKTILSRLSSLQRQIFQIGLRNDPASRVVVPGQDELSALADSINQTLLALEKAQNELRRSETATRALLEGMPDSLLRIDRNGVILDFKTGRDRAVAVPPRLFAGNTVYESLPEALAKKILSATEEALITNETQLFEHETAFNNQHLYLEIRVTPTATNETLTVFRDMTTTRELQQSLKFSDLRDTLTGVLNRIGWDQRLGELNLSGESRVGIIAVDIDEMRFINESLGISRGDQVLTATALAIRSSLPLDSLIARIGNDEFAALLLNRTEPELLQLCCAIRSEIDRSSLMEGALRFSLSLGCASSSPAEMTLTQLLESATESMHRNKLSQSHAARERIFESLQAVLSTRDFIVDHHARRLWALCQPLAKAAALPRSRLRSLKLLAQYHDIGKVGIPDQLLFKQGSLSPTEMSTMKLHVEIGHRIAQSIPDLFPIADLLLKHHEWWNGQGYPLGLAHEMIPLECRIFAIVDAFDAMTNDRPDRTAFSLKAAAAELRKCAGSQFDPILVDKFLAILGEEI